MRLLRNTNPVWRHAGFSVLELLIALAIVAVVAGIVVMAGRPVVRGQEGQAALRTMQQSVWQGATSAASRGVRTSLVLSGGDLEVRNADSNELIRRFELPDEVSLNVEQGQILAFTPPGKVDETTLASLPDPFRITSEQGTYDLQVSLIGEVRVARGQQ